MLSYFDFTGEALDCTPIEISWDEPMTLQQAIVCATDILENFIGGHIDIWYAETGEFACEVEV